MTELDVRLETWRGLITKMHNSEINLISIASNCEGKAEIEAALAEIEEVAGYYEALFSALAARLRAPGKELMERLREINKVKFRAQAREFRMAEGHRCTSYAAALAYDYYKDFKEKVYPASYEKTYIMHCKSFVTPFLFQPGVIPTSDFEERNILHDEFRGFNPEGFVKYFCSQLEKHFRNNV